MWGAEARLAPGRGGRTGRQGLNSRNMPSTSVDAAAPPQHGLVFLSCLALATGLITGFGAIFFRGLIALIHNLFFLGEVSVHYDANVHTPASPWGVTPAAFAVAGMAGVVGGATGPRWPQS